MSTALMFFAYGAGMWVLGFYFGKSDERISRAIREVKAEIDRLSRDLDERP